MLVQSLLMLPLPWLQGWVIDLLSATIGRYPVESLVMGAVGVPLVCCQLSTPPGPAWSHDQHIAKCPSLMQVGNMTAMQDIEASLGQNNSLPSFVAPTAWFCRRRVIRMACSVAVRPSEFV